MTLILDLDIGSRSLYTLNPKAVSRLDMSQIRPKGEKICLGQVISNGRTDGRMD